MHHALRSNLTRWQAIFALCLLTLAGLTARPSFADGTETLGAPSIVIASGTGVAVGGVGLVDPAAFMYVNVSVPAGATVNQVLLYWTTEYATAPGVDVLRVANTTDVTGAVIGGPTALLGTNIATYRADITSLGLVQPGDNTFRVESHLANGAGVVVIYDDGSEQTISLRDGQDILYADLSGSYAVADPQTFTFPASSETRDMTLSLLAAGYVTGSLPNALEVTVGGVTTTYDNFFAEADGRFFDSPTLMVTVPAGATSITVKPVSVQPPAGSTDLYAGKLGWIVAALSVPDVIQTPGCTLTWGYWKNHSTFGNASHKRDAGWDNLPQAEQTVFFLSGETYAQIMQRAVKGNVYYALAHQYIAAQLNRLAGAVGEPSVDQAFDAATALFQTYTPAAVAALKKNSALRAQFVAANETLDSFNNGNLGDSHCDSATADGQDIRGGGLTVGVSAVELGAAFPNPVRSTARIDLKLPESGSVRLAVYDVMGRLVATLADGTLGAGEHTFSLAAGDLASGTYFYRLETAAGAFTKKLSVVR